MGHESLLRVAFSCGVDRWWQKQRLTAKYMKMRLEGAAYPDVFCLPFFFADHFDFLMLGEPVTAGRYDLILSELQGSDAQLEYLESLVAAGHPVAVVPGPPEILARDLTQPKLSLVKQILSSAPHVWAYSQAIGGACDGLIGKKRATLIPWPFDYANVHRLSQAREKGAGIKVLLQVPVRFCGLTQNFPFFLKGVLADVWQSLPRSAQSRLSFHTFVYTPEDREAFSSSGFADGLPVILEEKRNYMAFVRLVAQCAAVVNLTAGSILGRVTFLAAALGKPGIFSDNCELNSALYPGSVVALLDIQPLRELLTELLRGLTEDNYACSRLLPCQRSATEIGDFAANREHIRDLWAGGSLCVASRASRPPQESQASHAAP